jgi:hypothetical protein
VVLDDPVAHREPEPRTRRLGREERLEQMPGGPPRRCPGRCPRTRGAATLAAPGPAWSRYGSRLRRSWPRARSWRGSAAPAGTRSHPRGGVGERGPAPG